MCVCVCLHVCVCVCVCMRVSPPPPLHPHCHSPKASLLNWLTDNKIIQERHRDLCPTVLQFTSAKAPGLHLKHCTASTASTAWTHLRGN